MSEKSESMAQIEQIVTFPHKLLTWLGNEIRWLFRVFLSAIDRFYWDNGFSRAAALAYTTLLSLVPVTVVAFGLLASFAVSNEYVLEVRKFIFQQFVPSTQAVDTVVHYLGEFGEIINNPNISVLAIGFFVIATLLLINSIEYSLNEIWQVYEPRSIPQRISIFCAILVLAPVLAVSAYYTSKLRFEPFLTEMGANMTYFDTFYRHALPFVIDFGAFFILYYLVPKAPVKLKAAVFGAVVVAVLFDFAKGAFAVYVVRFASYEAIYGTLAAIPIFLFWLYVTWTIVLFGAELCYQAQHLPKTGKVWKRGVRSVGDGILLLAAQSLVMVCRAFLHGERLPNELELAERLGCSTVVLRPSLAALKRAGILAQGDSRDAPIVLQRSPDTIRLDEVRTALYKGRSGVHFPTEMSRLFGAFESEEVSRTVTLEDLVKRSEADR